MGRIRIRAISTSKIINRIISKKNRIESGFRALESKLTPHSKVECFSDHFFDNFIRNSGTNKISRLIIIIIDIYITNHIIYL